MSKTVYDLINKQAENKNTSWLADGLVYLVETGSRAYGTSTPDSDRDYKGVVIPPLPYHIGLQTFKSVNITTGDNDSKNSLEDIDVTLYSLDEFIRMAVKGNPNILEMLFVDEGNIIVDNEVLRANKHIFLSTFLAYKFSGFSVTLEKRMTKKMSEGVYEGKTVMNLVRMIQMGQEALLTGDMNTKRPNAQELLAIRNRDVDVSNPQEVSNIINLMSDTRKEFRKAEDESILPSKVSMEKAEQLLMKLTLEHLELKQ